MRYCKAVTVESAQIQQIQWLQISIGNPALVVVDTNYFIIWEKKIFVNLFTFFCWLIVRLMFTSLNLSFPFNAAEYIYFCDFQHLSAFVWSGSISAVDVIIVLMHFLLGILFFQIVIWTSCDWLCWSDLLVLFPVPHSSS